MLSADIVWKFKTNGKTLNEEGAVWSVSKVKYDRSMIPENGFVITRTDSEKWNLKIKNSIESTNQLYYDNNVSNANLEVVKSNRSEYLIAGEGGFYEVDYIYDTYMNSPVSNIEIKYKINDANHLVIKYITNRYSYNNSGRLSNGILDLTVLTNEREKPDMVNIDLTGSTENNILIKIKFNTVTEIYRSYDR